MLFFSGVLPVKLFGHAFQTAILNNPVRVWVDSIDDFSPKQFLHWRGSGGSSREPVDVDGVGRARVAIHFPSFLQYLAILPSPLCGKMIVFVVVVVVVILTVFYNTKLHSSGPDRPWPAKPRWPQKSTVWGLTPGSWERYWDSMHRR